MALRQRVVTGIVTSGDGTPITSSRVSFQPTKPIGYTSTHVIVDRIFTATTDPATGAFSASLWCDDDSLTAIDYIVRFPSSNNADPDSAHSAVISLAYEDGSAKDIGTLITESTDASGVVAEQPLADLIDDRIALAGIIESGGTSVIQFRASDRTTPLPVADNITSWPFPASKTVSKIWAYVANPATTGTLTIGLKVGGASILSTPITIDAGDKTSLTAAVAAVLSSTSFAEGDELVVNILDDADGTASGLIITIV